MEYNLNKSLDSAIKRCEGMVVDDGIYQIYPFTTENISGYINYFNLNNKSLLTVGSSGDQVINAIMHGCNDVTLLDMNPYAKYYYYLKVSGILCLDRVSFLEFFRYKDYPKVFKNNEGTLNKATFEKIKLTLRVLDYESYLFWDELFQTFTSYDIRSNLFSYDEYRTYVIQTINDYLKDDESFNNTKKYITKTIPKFIQADIYNLKLNQKYDNVWLSNIATREISYHLIKKLTDTGMKLLNSDSLLMISYLYETKENTIYNNDWAPIYNLEKVRGELLKDYKTDIISFVGVDGIKFQSDNMKDSILVYKKS